MDRLKQYIQIEETIETLYTIIIHSTSSTEVLLYIDSLLDKAINIKNTFKINIISYRLKIFQKI